MPKVQHPTLSEIAFGEYTPKVWFTEEELNPKPRKRKVKPNKLFNAMNTSMRERLKRQKSGNKSISE